MGEPVRPSTEAGTALQIEEEAQGKEDQRLGLRSVAFLILLCGLFAAIGSLFGLVGAAIALSLAIVLAFWSYWSAGPELIFQSGAVPVTEAALVGVVEQLAARAGIAAPRLYEVRDRHPNALAVGSHPDNSAIIITSALRQCLAKDELAAVLAHEVAHIRNRDIFVATLAVTVVEAILLLAIPLAIIGLALRRNGGNSMIVIAVLAPVAALILRCGMARSVEYRADRDAAALCGNPAHVIAALRHLAGATALPCALAIEAPALAPLFFVAPLPERWPAALFCPHPPIEKRIVRLLAWRADAP